MARIPEKREYQLFIAQDRCTKLCTTKAEILHAEIAGK